ncbi:hypothetical protein GSI_14775 [Ganoderma sinense ZZ0214-1]|uniref:Uncharacterized protein n=1 Tax=Ganoderma sinense ZZ0214-1 TaxID=1077348 RepID=A0A2G8RPM2_9APHY|nr:hypothetical protein GSI_14775 [Ganoderma sinense ZZ0214-1]
MSTTSSVDPPQNASSTARTSVTSILSQSLPSFDHSAQVVTPFENESKRDAEFAEKLNTMLLELIIDFHAWAAARPAHEGEKMADLLEKEVKTLRDAEKEQGTSPLSSPSPPPSASVSVVEQTRQRLHDFITRIKLALAALTGLGA